MSGTQTFRVLERGLDPSAPRFSIEVALEGDCFRGHFPGRPVLPAVAQLQLVERLVRRAIGGAARTAGFRGLRFVRAVRPGETLDVRLEPFGDRVRFSVSGPDGPVSSGTLVIATAASG